MKKNLKMLLLALVVSLVPVVSAKAETVTYDVGGEMIEATEVGTYTELVEALGRNENISLTADIRVEAPISVSVPRETKEIYIFGEDYTLDGTGMVRDGANGSIITALSGSTVYLYNMNIKNANKYGVQAYNTGIVSVHEVTITDCTYGAILVNGGGLIVGDLTMGNNGEHTGGNGIEIGKAAGLTNEPIIAMVGSVQLLPGTQTVAIYLAENDALAEVGYSNHADSTDKLAYENNKLVIKDASGTVKYESNEAKTGLQVTEVPLTEDIPEVTPEEETTPAPTPATPVDNKVNENPNTYDGVLGYAMIAVLGFVTLAISFKKVLNKINA